MPLNLSVWVEVQRTQTKDLGKVPSLKVPTVYRAGKPYTGVTALCVDTASKKKAGSSEID